MRYFSTNRKSAHVSFRDAVLNGQPPDKGLYFPEKIPALGAGFWSNFREKSREQTAFEVIRPYIGGEIPDGTLFEVCAAAVSFEFPLVQISDTIWTLELFHGSTFAFKDVGARFMSRCLEYFSNKDGAKTIVVVATSGDTGGAVANGFDGAEGVEVVILYPEGKVSRVQELQLTTLGSNITALEVAGTFDDCQALAKTALTDAELKREVFLTSANSINVARWLPQQFYYFYALQQWSEAAAPVISVPSGNFGNICAGILAHVAGLPADRFIAACNANDVIPRFFATGKLETRPSVATLSNAMDVGNPSNFVRILEIFGNDNVSLKEKMLTESVTDEMTSETMRRVLLDYNYVLDPHGAVGFYALEKYLEQHPGKKGFFLETAHPVKFESVRKIVGTVGETPAAVRDLFARPEQKIRIEPIYDELKEIIVAKI